MWAFLSLAKTASTLPVSPPTGYLRPATTNAADSFDIDVSNR